jgi:hypothetical protein
MDSIVSIYNRLTIKEVTYEVGDDFVTATCELNFGGEKLHTQILMSHSDLNRIIAKISSLGYEFKVENINRLCFEDGTEIIDYKFENIFGEAISLENFQFNNSIKQIRA